MTGRATPRLHLLLSTARQSAAARVSREARETGLTESAAGVLFHLARHDRATAGELAGALHAGPAGMSGLLDRLVRRGLVTRRKNPDDGRSVIVELTADGAALLPQMRAVLADLNSELTAGFTDEEIAVVARWLRHVAALDRD